MVAIADHPNSARVAPSFAPAPAVVCAVATAAHTLVYPMMTALVPLSVCPLLHTNATALSRVVAERASLVGVHRRGVPHTRLPFVAVGLANLLVSLNVA